MKQHEYAKSLSGLRYPVAELTDGEKERINNLNFNLEELTAEHIVYALARAFGSMFHNIMKFIEEAAGEDVALGVARRTGVQYGKTNYGLFLKSKGAEHGSPALMCEFQDTVHSIRGPLHASARFGWFDDKKCVIRRKKCIYYEWHLEGTEKYVGALEQGIQAGYEEVDPAIVKTECPRCLWKGHDGCEQIWQFKP